MLPLLLFISNNVKILGPNRPAKITDHLTCISVNAVYCIACTLCKIYIGETGRRLADCFREHLWDVGKMTQMRPNWLPVFAFLVTLTTTWQFAGFPYTTKTQKAAKILNRNSSFNWVHSPHTGFMNAFALIYSQINVTIHFFFSREIKFTK